MLFSRGKVYDSSACPRVCDGARAGLEEVRPACRCTGRGRWKSRSPMAAWAKCIKADLGEAVLSTLVADPDV